VLYGLFLFFFKKLICSSRCQHGLELLGQWLEPCMALVWFLEVFNLGEKLGGGMILVRCGARLHSSTRLHGGTSTTSTFLVSLKSQLKNLKNAKIKNACGAFLLSIFCPCPVLSLSFFLFLN